MSPAWPATFTPNWSQLIVTGAEGLERLAGARGEGPIRHLPPYPPPPFRQRSPWGSNPGDRLGPWRTAALVAAGVGGAATLQTEQVAELHEEAVVQPRQASEAQ
jgi:hypothetical protein